MNKEEFITELEKINITLSKEQIEQLEKYKDFLIEYNQHTNLTAIKTPEDIYLKHFYDSLILTQIIDFNNYSNLLDIGTGAGFPGVVLKIAFPHLKISLLDSNGKKIEFLRQLIKKIKLNDVELINDRAEEYIQNKRETFDIVTSRAVSNMSIITELSIPYVKVGGYFLAMKGSNQEEILEAQKAIDILGGKIEINKIITLPKEESTRQLISIKKQKNTPLEYPRRYDKIIKKPLKNNNK